MTQTFNFTDWFNASGASTAVEAAYFDADTEQVAITLAGGSTYVYQGFSTAYWEAFVAARSLGSFYAREIKGEFDRNDGYSPEGSFEFIKRTPFLAKPAEPVSEVRTTVVLKVDGNVTLELDGELTAGEALAAFLTQYHLSDARVISRKVTKVENYS